MRLEPCVCSGVRPQTQEMLNVRRNSHHRRGCLSPVDFIRPISRSCCGLGRARLGEPLGAPIRGSDGGTAGRANGDAGRRFAPRLAATAKRRAADQNENCISVGRRTPGSVSTSNATAGNPAARNWSGSLKRRLLSFFDSSLVAAFAMVWPQVSPNASVNEPKHNNRRHADSGARVGRDRFPP